jgi:hypothetical protein
MTSSAAELVPAIENRRRLWPVGQEVRSFAFHHVQGLLYNADDTFAL